MYSRAETTTSNRRQVLRRELAKEGDDVLDEIMHGGKHLRAAFNRDADDDDRRQYQPGNEPNERRAADELAWIDRGELNQSTDPDFNSRRVVTHQKP